ncbi:fumarylacetoacetate hydrolase family protein [Paenibacillus vulneris]|uniref:Fumarylacetoacetate hydrolase family protein n=1 Tax=Paenibacillus vulneris TaxID=1133364 RepID=A0ABW3UE87_9BACL
MRIIRYLEQGKAVMAAVTEEGSVYPLEFRDLFELVQTAEKEGITAAAWLERELPGRTASGSSMEEQELLVPITAPEVWAAGVTYERSRQARNYEATGGKLDASTFYDKVYDAERPELFFKSTAARTVGPGGTLCLRSDSAWQIPEPELGLVIDRAGRIIGYTIGNDMSCRDIEGENPLYLPQAKMWRRSCSIGPAIRLADTVADPYALDIVCRIYRHGQKVVEGTASTGQLKRRLEELVSFLTRDNDIFDGTVLLTGTCIVPPNEFTLQDGDRIEIGISGIGTLTNEVKTQERMNNDDWKQQSHVS